MRRLQGFLSSLSTDLRYRGEDIFTLVTECAKRAGLTALSVQPSEDSFENAWNKAINGVCAAFPLQREDESLLREIGSQLGKTDLEGQLRHLSLIGAAAGRGGEPFAEGEAMQNNGIFRRGGDGDSVDVR